jgi:hypothetical protein
VAGACFLEGETTFAIRVPWYGILCDCSGFSIRSSSPGKWPGPAYKINLHSRRAVPRSGKNGQEAGLFVFPKNLFFQTKTPLFGLFLPRFTRNKNPIYGKKPPAMPFFSTPVHIFGPF